MKRRDGRLSIEEAREFANKFFYDPLSYQPNLLRPLSPISPIDKISEEQLKNARIAFAPYSEISEIPLLLYDDTALGIFGSAAESGILITNAAIYYALPNNLKGTQKGRLSLADVKKFDCVVKLLGNEIKVNGDILGCPRFISKDEAAILTSFVNNIVALINDESDGGATERTAHGGSGAPPLNDSNVTKVWEISKSSVMNKEINLDIVRDFILNELRQTDIGWKQLEKGRVQLERVGSFSTNRVGFKGELAFAETDTSIGVQLFGLKDSASAAVGGAWDACMSAMVCPPMLLCVGGEYVQERKYVEKTVEAILKKLAAQIGSKFVHVA
jgi:hypothetical protein